ncbi:MAG TPA: hypothetical protein VFG86_22015, partial [Chloroflexota bacterium]|nr:hypothetical protein [Chloroflexota bacterium]
QPRLQGEPLLLHPQPPAATGARAAAEIGRVPESFAGKVNAPEFPEGLAWINTSRPLTLRELRGKLVVLDFWTFC